LPESEIKLLTYQVEQLVKKHDIVCNDLKELFEKMDKRVVQIETRVAWVYGLLAGLGVVSVATLIKMFLGG